MSLTAWPSLLPRRAANGRTDMSDTIKLSSVSLDCPDATELAAFYAEITGGTVVYRDAGWATVDGPGGRIDWPALLPGDEMTSWLVPDPREKTLRINPPRRLSTSCG